MLHHRYLLNTYKMNNLLQIVCRQQESKPFWNGCRAATSYHFLLYAFSNKIIVVFIFKMANSISTELKSFIRSFNGGVLCIYLLYSILWAHAHQFYPIFLYIHDCCTTKNNELFSFQVICVFFVVCFPAFVKREMSALTIRNEINFD